MILGIGTDIVQIPRIEKLLGKYGNYFVKKILNGTELEQYVTISIEARAEFIAKRFAAKEAVAKAFGTGMGTLIKLHDICISNDIKGKPEAKANCKHAEGKKIFLSIADDYPVAVAFAVVSV